MIRRLACILLPFSLMAPLTAHAASPIEGAFGNTVVSTYPDGRQGELWLEPGGAYTSKGRRGDLSGGHWTVKGEQLCLKQSKPISVFFSFCTPIPSAGTGGEWSAKAVTGEPIKVKIVKGHVEGPAKS